MRTTVAALIAVIAGASLAAISPRQDYVTDCSQPPVKRSLTFVQASSQQLGWTFQQGTTAKDLTGATSILFVFSPSTRAWSQTITGSLDVATNGSVLVTMTPTQLNTNTATTGALDWMLYVADTTQTLAYAYGKLNLITDPSQSVTNTFSPASPNATEAWVVAQGYGTGNVSTAYLTAQGYGTGNLSKATADVTYAPISVSVSGVTSNYAVTIPGGTTNWLAITNGLIKSIQSSDVWQLVSNGTFTDGVTGWTTNVISDGGSWAFDGSTAVLTGPAGPPRVGTLTQSITGLTAGRTYRATFTCAMSATGSVKIYIGGTAGTNRSAGTWTEDIVAGATGEIYLWPNTVGPGDTVTIDNVTLYDVTP